MSLSKPKPPWLEETRARFQAELDKMAPCRCPKDDKKPDRRIINVGQSMASVDVCLNCGGVVR